MDDIKGTIGYKLLSIKIFVKGGYSCKMSSASLNFKLVGTRRAARRSRFLSALARATEQLSHLQTLNAKSCCVQAHCRSPCSSTDKFVSLGLCTKNANRQLESLCPTHDMAVGDIRNKKSSAGLGFHREHAVDRPLGR